MSQRWIGSALLLGLVAASMALLTTGQRTKSPVGPGTTEPEPGQLTMLDATGKPSGLCPLQGTKVSAEISGFGARVTLVQTFTNPSKDTIEAIYTFPLPSDAAVDRMRMRIADRVIDGEIKQRDEARQIYETAKAQGMTVALLDQERPNIFTQSVANITPGAKIEVEISYVQLLKFEDGEFEFMYPMVVGPRYVGASVTDPGKIAPPITPKGTRTGANIDLTVWIDAGARITSLSSKLHEIKATGFEGDIGVPLMGTKNIGVDRDSMQRAQVRLLKRDVIPNRDFILRYGIAAGGVTNSVLTHVDPKRGGYFSLILMPPKAPQAQMISPKEVMFIIDQTGSQSGFPIQKSKELTLKLIKTLKPNDTFNVMGFNTSQALLWQSPQPVNEGTLAEATKFIESMEASGGTDILGAVRRAFDQPRSRSSIRLITFNTDGYIGNEAEILNEIQKHRQDMRMFTFGIGNSVNRFLVDAMSAEGKGDSEIVTLATDADPAVERFVQRTENPILTEISVKFEGVAVQDVLPKQIPDVFSEKPIIIKGRFSRPGAGKITLSGKLGGQPFSQDIPIEFPATDSTGSAIATIWAREKVDDITRGNWLDSIAGKPTSDTTKAITQIGLDYCIMTQFTSFVAVEKRVVNVGGKQRTIAVPVDMADGVSYDGIYGVAEDKQLGLRYRSLSSGKPAARGSAAGFGGGGGRGAGQIPSTAPMPAVSRAQTGATATKGKSLPAEEKDAVLREAAANRAPSKLELQRATFESKVHHKLRSLTSGKVEVQVFLKETSAATLAKLKKAGLKVDELDKGLRIAFGTCDVKALKALSLLAEVVRITPLE